MNHEDGTVGSKIKRTLIGKPRDIKDPTLFHKMALIPVLAWVGLGADGLSSSAYGPEEAFRALGEHTYLALFLALATALTVFIISYAYSRIIEHFPHGGGGYIVATHMLGEKAGRGLRQRPAGRLRPDHHHLHRLLRRCACSASSPAAATITRSRSGLRPDHRPDRPQHARRQGVDHRPGADLHGLRRSPIC